MSVIGDDICGNGGVLGLPNPAFPHLFTLFSHLGVHWWSFLFSPDLYPVEVLRLCCTVSLPLGPVPLLLPFYIKSLKHPCSIAALSQLFLLALSFKVFLFKRIRPLRSRKHQGVLTGSKPSRGCRQGLPCALCAANPTAQTTDLKSEPGSAA